MKMILNGAHYNVVVIMLLLLAKALSLFNGIVHLLNELFIAAVRRQVKSVEARMTARKPRVLADSLYTEMLRAVAP